MTRHPVRHWTINGDFTALEPTGVARYAREVTVALDTLVAEGHPLAQDLAVTLVIPRALREPLPLRALAVEQLAEFRSPRLPQFWVQVQLPFRVRGGLLSFCNLAPVSVMRQIVCIHDLNTWTSPESYSLIFRLAHRIILPLLGQRCHTITTVSEFSRDQLVQFCVAPEDKIVVTYNGHEHAKRWGSHRIAARAAGNRPFVLGLGRAHRHKNTGLLWRLADGLDEMGLDIHVAGRFDAAAFAIEGRGPPRNLRLLGRIDDEEFGRALRDALCFLFPSRTEGFGLPGIEAMALGCPLVSADVPCLREIYGDAALYAGPDEPTAWIAAIDRLRRDRVLREEFVLRGLARAERYSWRTIAEQYLELMAEADGWPRRPAGLAPIRERPDPRERQEPSPGRRAVG
ncbi:glycosyltransferase family 1 protein [Chelatococcus sp. SYSU_G07232]|uniref:Glycosyltransferase family 1 protein n=1 Tax=Chelatococcus albus TaxID=3047466 RepID=A0ABT7ACH9_9HYPH|nr:glycosyltransferase family 1 protein [Chelatococcus sp. SYSU_G07232]MDJ1157080.1 glycosyltransferase family 1 protein [Chelatococcus sp. SYSU_G07232]